MSVTFDSLLADAINAIRYGGNAKTEVIVYSPNDVQDLWSDKKSLDRPVVYHFLGKLSASPDYVVCDEDVLEFLQAMQTDSRRPHLLFDELKDNHLLILGCSFSDWLARFSSAWPKNQPLSLRRDQMEVLVDSAEGADTNLALFLQSFSYNTRVIPGTAAEFVAELSRRWHERHPEDQKPPAPPGPDATPMAPGAIFLSYASDDREGAERIKAALEAAGLEMWFDKRRLEAGDDWDQKIRCNIANCSLFVPIVSHATESRLEGYFRREWAWAADRALGIAEEVPFIVPVTIDDTPAYTAKVPERFKLRSSCGSRARPGMQHRDRPGAAGDPRLHVAQQPLAQRLTPAFAVRFTRARVIFTRPPLKNVFYSIGTNSKSLIAAAIPGKRRLWHIRCALLNRRG